MNLMISVNRFPVGCKLWRKLCSLKLVCIKLQTFVETFMECASAHMTSIAKFINLENAFDRSVEKRHHSVVHSARVMWQGKGKGKKVKLSLCFN
jgi:hypothetical protein